MKNLLIGFLLMTLASQAFADCRSVIDARIQEKEANADDAWAFGITGIGTIVLSEMSLAQLEKLKRAVDQAYDYREGNIVGKDFKKLVKKIKRKAEKNLTNEEITNAIILSNENNELCSVNSINQLAKKISF